MRRPPTRARGLARSLLPGLALLFAVAPAAALAQGRAFSATSLWDLHPTDVADAADGPDPYDFDLAVWFDQSMESGTIQREYHCSNQPLLRPADGGGYTRPDDNTPDGNCSPTEDRIVSARELDFERVKRRIQVLARFGIWKDIEFHVALPIVLGDQIKLTMASQSDKPGSLPLLPYCGGPECSQSSVYRENKDGESDEGNSFFLLPNTSPKRAALSDPTIGVWWAPFNHERDDVVATWRLGVDYTLNVVDRMQPESADRVGQGFDELRFSTAMSRRFAVMRPFLEVSYSIANLIETDSTPFHDFKKGQTLVEPGDQMGLRFGSQVVPWEDPALEQWFALDFGGEFVYQFKGRDYTPLYTALGTSACNSIPGCELTQLSGMQSDGTTPMRTTGITDVEQFGVLRGWFGLTLQAFRMVRFQARAVVARQFSHFLTFADAGRDNGVQDEGQDAIHNDGIIDPGTDEENPVFNEYMDLAGSRFRLSSHLDFGFMFAGIMTF